MRGMMIWGSIGIVTMAAFILAAMIVMSGDASFLYNWRR